MEMTTYRRYAGGRTPKSAPGNLSGSGGQMPKPLKNAGLLEYQCIVACAGVLILLLIRLAGGDLLKTTRSVCTALMEDNIDFGTYTYTEKVTEVFSSLFGEEKNDQDRTKPAASQNMSTASESSGPDYEEGTAGAELGPEETAAESAGDEDDLSTSADVSIVKLTNPSLSGSRTTSAGDILPAALLTSATLEKSDSFAEKARGGLLEAPPECSFEPFFTAMKLTLPLKGAANVNCKFGYRYHPITGEFGFHTGTDLGASLKDTIYAAGAGTVLETGKSAVWGNYILIDHGNKTQTFYAHCYKLAKKKGAKVKLGEKIATVGSTGLSTGPHLHFEIRVDGVYMDASWLIVAN